MKVTSVKVNRENKNVEIVVSNQIPFTEYKPGSDFDIDKHRKQQMSYNMDLLGSFSKRIIASLKRRMEACITNLGNHVNDVIYCDEYGCVRYKRNNKSDGKFNLPSYKLMEDLVKMLEASHYKDVLTSVACIDQIMKALLNDTEMDHSDCGCFAWSDLISMLCEIHACGARHE